jgi:hypothetical protein
VRLVSEAREPSTETDAPERWMNGRNLGYFEKNGHLDCQSDKRRRGID